MPLSSASTTRRSRSVFALFGVVAVLVLSACEKPTPLVTVLIDGTVVKSEANSYCRDECKTYPENAPPRIDVRPGGQVGVDVARNVAEGGWRATIQNAADLAPGAQPTSAPALVLRQTDHYGTFIMPTDLPAGVTQVALVVVMNPQEGDAAILNGDNQPVGKGAWTFILRLTNGSGSNPLEG